MLSRCRIDLGKGESFEVQDLTAGVRLASIESLEAAEDVETLGSISIDGAIP